MTTVPPPAAWDGLDALRPDLESFLAHRTRDVHAIDDAVQECFIRAARHRTRLQSPSALRGWLRRIGANALADAHRGSRRPLPPLPDEVEEELVSPLPEPSEICDEPEVRYARRTIGLTRAREAIVRALGSLPSIDRRMLVCVYMDGNSRDQAARRLGVDPDLLKVRLFRARKRLRRALRHALEAAA